jgi:hypothetical protein
MKSSLIVHACWAAAAALAFGLGARSGSHGSDRDRESAAATGNRRLARTAEEVRDRASRTRDERETTEKAGALARRFGAVASDIDTLISQTLRDPNPITRRLAFAKLLESMTPENALAMRGQLLELGADSAEWRDFHYAWGAIAGQEAFDQAADSPERDLAATLSGWAAANPAQAMAMLDALPESLQGQRDELTASVVAGLADHSRDIAADFVVRLGSQDSGRAAGLMDIVAREAIRAEGPAAASRWSESLPDGPLKGAAMSRVAEVYARQDPEAAARWAEAFAAESYAANAIERIGGGWARSNPIAAVGWLESLPAGNGQTAGLRTAFSDWEDSDPVAAGEYLMAMPQSPQRDSAISGFATGYAWQNPQIAIAWAQDIRDPALRESSLTRAGQAFYRRDPAGATAWLETSDLPAEARQQILQSDRRR